MFWIGLITGALIGGGIGYYCGVQEGSEWRFVRKLDGRATGADDPASR